MLAVLQIAPDRRARNDDVCRCPAMALLAQLQSVGVTAMSSAITSVATVSALTEQPVPGAELETVPIPQELWIVLVLSVILFVLLAWRAIAEGDGSGDDGSSNTWFPPF
jgi:hypothetical protein